MASADKSSRVTKSTKKILINIYKLFYSSLTIRYLFMTYDNNLKGF